MKLLKQKFEKDSSGFVVLYPQDKEDLWAIYNLIQNHDVLSMKTERMVKKEKSSKAKTEKKVLYLSISVENVDFEAEPGLVRVRGKTTEQHDDVPLGSYHTMQIVPIYQLSLYKDQWDARAYEIITKACNVESKAEVGAIVLQEGVAHICLLSDSMTFLKSKIEKSIPKKRRGDNSGYEKAMQKFYHQIYEAVKANLDYTKLKAIIVASPGFNAAAVCDYIFERAAAENNKTLLQSKQKFIVTHSSTGYLQALEEVLKKPEIQKQLSDTKYVQETKALDDFFEVLNLDNGKAWYGPKEVEKAIMMGAVQTLLLTDTLFRSNDNNERKKYIELSKMVEQAGGKVYIFSSMHESGEQLDQITGIAAMLKYPIMDLDESDEE